MSQALQGFLELPPGVIGAQRDGHHGGPPYALSGSSVKEPLDMVFPVFGQTVTVSPSRATSTRQPIPCTARRRASAASGSPWTR